MLESMAKVTVVAPKKSIRKVISKLHTLKVLHITAHTKGDLDIGTPGKKAERLSELLLDVNGLISTLNARNGHPEKELTTDVLKKIKGLKKHVVGKQDHLKRLEEEYAEKKSALEKIGPFTHIDLPFEYYSGYDHFASFAGRVNGAAELRKALQGIPHELTASTEGTMIFLVVPKEREAECRKILKAASFQSVEYDPSWKGVPREIARKLGQEIRALETQITKIKEHLGRLGKKSSKLLVSVKNALEQELEKEEAPLKMAASDACYFLTGWVPESRARQVERALDDAHVSIKKPGKKDAVPIKLRNPEAARPFELFLDLFSLPRYKEIDPTLFFAITFPLFFGFIVGDIGYGLAGFALTWHLARKMPSTRNFMKILMLASLSSIFFGGLFGEFFGEEEIIGMRLPHIFSRAHEMMTLLVVAVAIGIVQINFGLLLGFLNEKKRHGLKHAVLAKLSWIVLQAGVAVLALEMLGIIPAFSAGYALIGIALVMLYKGEGINGLIELPGIFTNILSYARLMAIGLSSVSIALVINEFAAEWINAGGLMLIGAILLLIVGHSINLALGYLGGFLHSLRLHYVEFFTKFYQGGGFAFRAFGDKR